jgi:hypothetical protein
MGLRHDTVHTGTAGAAQGTMRTTAEVHVQRSKLLQLEQNTITQRNRIHNFAACALAGSQMQIDCSHWHHVHANVGETGGTLAAARAL